MSWWQHCGPKERQSPLLNSTFDSETLKHFFALIYTFNCMIIHKSSNSQLKQQEQNFKNPVLTYMCLENKIKQNSLLQVSSLRSKQQRSTHRTQGSLRTVLISRKKQRQGNELIKITMLAQFPQCYAVCSVTEHGGCSSLGSNSTVRS